MLGHFPCLSGGNIPPVSATVYSSDSTRSGATAANRTGFLLQLQLTLACCLISRIAGAATATQSVLPALRVRSSTVGLLGVPCAMEWRGRQNNRTNAKVAKLFTVYIFCGFFISLLNRANKIVDSVRKFLKRSFLGFFNWSGAPEIY